MNKTCYWKITNIHVLREEEQRKNYDKYGIDTQPKMQLSWNIQNDKMRNK